MTQQSLEELSSIYSEASELGLTSLGVTEPGQGEGEDQEGMVQQPSAAMMIAAKMESSDAGGGGGYYSDQDTVVQPSAAEQTKLGSREPEDYYSDVETMQHDDGGDAPTSVPAADLQLQDNLEGYYSDQVRWSREH